MDRLCNPLVSGLVSNCAVCGKHPVRFDYIVSDKLWDEVVPKELSPDVICLDCFEEMSNGIPKDEWRIVYYTGKAGTIAFTPVDTLGWRCPVCGRGLAPHVSECSCAKNVENAWNFWVDALETMKRMGIIPFPPPEA